MTFYSLSNYSLGEHSSARSSINDRGVFNEDLDSVSQDKLRVQVRNKDEECSFFFVMAL